MATADPFAARVDFVARGFALTEAILREYWQATAVRDLAAQPEPGRLLDGLERLAQLTAQREQVFEAVMQDELLSGTYDRLVRERASRLNSWKGDLNAAWSAALAALFTAGDAVSPERLARIAASASDAAGAQVAAFAWVLEHPDAENLCPNPGFEETAGEAAEGGRVRADANEAVAGAGGTGRWQLLSAAVLVPEGAGRLVVLPRALDQEEGDVVLLDDARIIRLPDDFGG